MPNIRDLSALVRELAPVVKAHVASAFGPLAARVKALEDRAPEKGERGEPGPAGKDAEPVDYEALADAVVAKLLASDRLDTLADLKATEAVAAHFEANPVRHGKDGKDGERGPQGERGAEGPAGRDGRDGLDVKDMLRSHDGHLIAVMSDGTTRDLGEFVGKDGAPGKDGADFSDVEIDYDGERTLTIRGKGGEIVKRLPIPMDRGYFRDGMGAEKGDIVTHDGIAWIALRDTRATPSIANKEDWRIFARKGRDGKDGRNGIDKTAAVKVES